MSENGSIIQYTMTLFPFYFIPLFILVDKFNRLINQRYTRGVSQAYNFLFYFFWV